MLKNVKTLAGPEKLHYICGATTKQNNMKGSRIHFTTAEHGETIAEGIVGTYARSVYLWNSFGDIIRMDIDKLHSAIMEGKSSGTVYDIKGIYMDWERFRNSQRKRSHN